MFAFQALAQLPIAYSTVKHSASAQLPVTCSAVKHTASNRKPSERLGTRLLFDKIVRLALQNLTYVSKNITVVISAFRLCEYDMVTTKYEAT